MDQLSHTLEVKPNLFIQAFIKFYDLKAPYGLNTCKLFWGTLGMIVIPPVLIVLSPLIGLILLMAYLSDKADYARAQARRAEQDAYWKMTYEEQLAYDNPPPKPKSSRAEKLEQFSAWAGAVWFKIATPVTWFFRFAVGAAFLFGLILFVPWIAGLAVEVAWGSVLVYAGRFLLGGAIGLGITWLIIKWREKHPKVSTAKEAKRPSVIKAVFHSVHDHTCANIEVK